MAKKSLWMIVCVLLIAASPAFPASKEILQLQQQMELLMAQVRDLQRGLDTNVAVMKSLISQNTDTVNKLSQQVSAVQQTLQTQSALTGQRQDQSAQRFQAIDDALDEVRTQLNSMSGILTQLQNNAQNIPAPQQQPAQPAAQSPATPNKGSVLPPEQLFKNGLTDYVSGAYPLARDEFSSFLQSYPNDDHAPDAAYYLGDIFAKQRDYQKAVDQFDTVLQKYPQSRLAAGAQLKKGYALVAMGKRDSAIHELRGVISNHPNTQEARAARDELDYLGASRTRASK